MSSQGLARLELITVFRTTLRRPLDRFRNVDGFASRWENQRCDRCSFDFDYDGKSAFDPFEVRQGCFRLWKAWNFEKTYSSSSSSDLDSVCYGHRLPFRCATTFRLG